MEAFETLERAHTTMFDTYEREGRGVYHVVTGDRIPRGMSAAEVPAYVVGHRDAYAGMLKHVRAAMEEAALAGGAGNKPEDFESFVMDYLDRNVGVHYREAASSFVDDEPQGHSKRDVA